MILESRDFEPDFTFSDSENFKIVSLKIFIFWKIFIRADKIEIKSVQNCALKIFSFENFDF